MSKMMKADNGITGTPYDDIIYGGKGDDSILHYGGDDIIYGGKGEDVIWYHAYDGSAPEFHGGKGNDQFHLRCGQGYAKIMDYEVGDTIYVREELGEDGCPSIQLTSDRSNGDVYLYQGSDLIAVFYGAAELNIEDLYGGGYY